MTAIDVHAFEVRVAHATLHGEWAGAGAAVVLLHAGICDRRMWDAEFAALAEGYRVVRYDPKGVGESLSAPATDDLPFAHHDDLLAVLGHLALDRATVVGSSFGGRVAIDAALAAPDRVAGLVTVDSTPVGWPWDATVRAAWSAIDATLERGDVAEANERELRLRLDSPRRGPTVVDPDLRVWVGAMNAMSLAAGWSGSGEQPLDPPAAGRLGAVSCLALLMVGDLDLPGGIAAGESMAAAMPLAELACFPAAGHLPSLEAPDRFLAELNRFLARATVNANQPAIATA